jgi:ketoreductase RED2
MEQSRGDGQGEQRMGELEGGVAIITGSSSGIGEAVARRLADLGASIVVNSSSSVERGTAVAASLPTPSVYVQADISDAEQARRLVDHTVDRYGRLDIVINNAAWLQVLDNRDLDALTDEILLKMFGVNVFGAWWVSKAAMPHLRESPDPNIINMSSVSGIRAQGSSMAYSMTKATLNQMTHLLARYCAPVRVNAVAPGMIDTPWTDGMDSMRGYISKVAPMRRPGTTDECAEAVLGLLRNPYVTGHVFVVDGGLMWSA